MEIALVVVIALLSSALVWIYILLNREETLRGELKAKTGLLLVKRVELDDCKERNKVLSTNNMVLSGAMGEQIADEITELGAGPMEFEVGAATIFEKSYDPSEPPIGKRHFIIEHQVTVTPQF